LNPDPSDSQDKHQPTVLFCLPQVLIEELKQQDQSEREVQNGYISTWKMAFYFKAL
jgi:hypothetical protein